RGSRRQSHGRPANREQRQIPGRADGAQRERPVNAGRVRGLMDVMTSIPIPMSDPELATQIRVRDEQAFAELVAEHQPVVFRWALALSGDADDAEDITQEVFVRVYRKLASFRGEGTFEGWLYRITRRVAFRSQRKAVPAQLAGDAEIYVTDPGARVDRH